MPVGNVSPPNTIYPINGIKIGVTSAGVRYQNRDDLVVIAIDQGASTAVVTTQNAFCASPVQLVRKHIKASQMSTSQTNDGFDTRYLLINTGNANAGTGVDGDKRAPLNSDAIIAGLDDTLADLSADNWLKGANAILTTDTVAKVASEKVQLADGTEYHITGMSKGSGMIRPNMATMLGYIATDASIAPELLQAMLEELVNLSFNRITVDGDTSTNDCCTLIATNKVINESISEIDSTGHPHYSAVFKAMKAVFVRLATLIVRDGEGASKFITVQVTGGETTQECCDVAYAVAHSPLVKTAFFASDPNWGRILASVGYAGLADLDTTQISIHLDDVLICERGMLADSYTEEDGQTVMNRPEIRIHIELGRGEAEDTVYTCDLSYDYVKINADYRS